MKYYLVAGEASGDLHGANLMKALKEKDAQSEFRFFGGDLMKAESGTLVKHIAEMSFMGFYEVVMNLSTIFKNLKFFYQKTNLYDCPNLQYLHCIPKYHNI